MSTFTPSRYMSVLLVDMKILFTFVDFPHSSRLENENGFSGLFKKNLDCLRANLLRRFFSFCIVRNMIIFRENVLSLWPETTSSNLVSSSIVTQKNIRWDYVTFGMLFYKLLKSKKYLHRLREEKTYLEANKK